VVNKALERAVLADPDRADAYLVYGDWLAARGDPRGELVAVQHAVARAPGDERLRTREQQLIAAARRAIPGDDSVRLCWRLGFVEQATVEVERCPGSAPELLHQLLQDPACRFIRSLVLEKTGESVGPEALVLLLRESLGSPLLERLSLDCHEVPLEQLTALLSDRLVELSLRWRSGLAGDALRALVARPWPRLVRLVLHAGDTQDHQDEGGLAALLNSAQLPRLRHLALHGHDPSDAMGRLLFESSLLPQLASFGLTVSSLSAPQRAWWIANREDLGSVSLVPDEEDLFRRRGDFQTHQLIDLLLQLGLGQQVLERFERRVDAGEAEPWILFAQARLLEALGQNEAAAEIYDTVSSARGGKSGYTYYKKQVALRRAGRYEEALEAANEAVRLSSPTDPFPLQARGYLCRKLGRDAEAVECLSRVLEIFDAGHYYSSDQNPADRPYQRACVLALLGRHDEALEQLRQVIAQEPDYARRAQQEIDFEHLRDSPLFIQVVSPSKTTT
jgi:uncharacterized protein (TIGR02996 family)